MAALPYSSAPRPAAAMQLAAPLGGRQGGDGAESGAAVKREAVKGDVPPLLVSQRKGSYATEARSHYICGPF